MRAVSKYIVSALCLALYIFGSVYIVQAQEAVSDDLISSGKYFKNGKMRLGLQVGYGGIGTTSASEDKLQALSAQKALLNTEFLFLNNSLAFSTGVGLQQSKVSYTEAGSDIKAGGIIDDSSVGQSIVSDRFEATIPAIVKWRSPKIGANKKAYIGMGVNTFFLLSNDAFATFEEGGVVQSQKKRVTESVDKTSFEGQASAGLEFQVASNFIVTSGLSYKSALNSYLSNQDVSADYIGFDLGVFF